MPIDLNNMKHPVLRVALSCFVPYKNSPGKGDVVDGEIFVELAPKLTNAELMKSVKKAVLDIRDLARKHEPREQDEAAQVDALAADGITPPLIKFANDDVADSVIKPAMSEDDAVGRLVGGDVSGPQIIKADEGQPQAKSKIIIP